MKRGDLVQITTGNTARYGIVVSGTGRPDSYLLVLDSQARARKRYPDSCEVLGAVINGKQHLDHEQAAIRAELAELAASRIGKEVIRNARMAATVVIRRGQRSVKPHDIEPGGGDYGSLADYEPPLRMDGGEMDRYLAVRDVDDPDQVPSRDAREVRYLDRLKAANPRYYQVYVAMRAGARTNDIATLENISVEAAKKLRQRAESAYRRICLDWGQGA